MKVSPWARDPGKTGGSLTIGVLCPVVGGFYFGRLLAGMTRVLRAGGHRLVAVQTYPADLDRDEFPVPPHRREPPGLGSYDGLVIVTSALADEDLRRIDATDIPLVAVGVAHDDLRAPSVAPDNSGAVRALVDHLVDHGHRRIGFLGNTDQVDIAERYDAFRSALVEHGLEHPPEAFLHTRDLQEASAELVGRRAVERGLGTTATVAATDRNAVGFLRALRQAGLTVPDDQAVVGFDNSDSGARSWPRLTSVDVRHDAVGQRAAELLLARIRGERVTGRHRLDHAVLVMRESCGCGVGTRSALVGRVSQPGDPDPLGAVAEVVFAHASTAGRRGGLDSWLATLRQLVEAAVATAAAPPEPALRVLGERTAALRPAPGALEQLVPAVHAEAARVRRRLSRHVGDARVSEGAGPPGGLDLVDSGAAGAALERVVVALVRGCTHGDLARAGRLEQELTDLERVDLELMRSDGQALRRLDWVPRTRTATAALALWEGDPDRPGLRRLRVVGARGGRAGGDALIGRTMRATQFPPPAVTVPSALTVVVPVAFGRSDRGYLAVGGLVDTRATSTRARYNHWAAMLAVALEAEDSLTSLQAQRHQLAQVADRQRALATDVAAEEERAALASIAADGGIWDWDVDAGAVRYSAAWARLVGEEPGALREDPQEWFCRVHPDDVRKLHEGIAAQLSGTREPLAVEHRLRSAGGRYVRVSCRAVTVHDAADRPVRIVGSLMPTASAPRAVADLAAPPDPAPVAGLLPRDRFHDLLERAVRRARRVPGYPWQVLAVRFRQQLGEAERRLLLAAIPPDEAAVAVGARTVVVLLDGCTGPEVGRLAGRTAATLGDAGVVGVVPLVDPEPASAEAVMRRVPDALGDPVRFRA